MSTASLTTGKLTVRYGPYPADTAEALIPIDIVSPTFRVRQSLLQLGSPIEFDLAPGPYLVRAYLPSGEILTAQTRVETGRPSSVSLHPGRPSPREDLTWAYCLKQVGAVSMESQASGGPAEDVGPGPRFDFALWQRIPSQTPSSWSVADEGAASITAADDTIRQADPHALVVVSLRLPVSGGAHPASGEPEMINEYWIQVKGPTPFTRFVALPIPPALRPQVRVLVVQDPHPGTAGASADKDQEHPVVDHYSLLVNTGNARAEMLLGYLAAGAFEVARRVGENVVDLAEAMLREKRDDPSSAAIAGYYLLKAGQLKRLHDWTRNLDEWFPWLPDGPVIRAWHLLRQDNPDLTQSRARLLEAERRGLPRFTQGLRLLFDGLDFFAHKVPDDTKVVLARDRLQRYARAANWRAMTTSFYAENPAHPNFPRGFRG